MAKKKSSKGGVKGGLVAAVVFLLLLGIIFAWAKVNNIKSIEDAYDYFKSWGDHSRECLNVQDNGRNPVEVGWRCDEGKRVPVPTSPPSGTSGSGSTTPPSDGSPTNPTPTAPGKPGNPTDDPSLDQPKETFLKELATVKVAAPAGVSYNRSEWKHWSGTPCDTRQKVLQRDGVGVKVEKTTAYCVVASGKWISPYDKKEYTEARLLDIDHVVPLNYAAQHGGASWPASKKEAFANDMTQLLAVSAGENRGKGDDGPSEYMPPEASFQCTYSKIWVSTVTKYGLTITDKDKAALQSGLQKC